MTTPPHWPGLKDNGLALPLPSDWFSPTARTLTVDGHALRAKDEFHLTLLDQAAGSQVLAALDESQVRDLFEAEDWAVAHSGNGVVVRKTKADAGAEVDCYSLIEMVTCPSMQRFRSVLAEAAGMSLPEAPPHVTLYTFGDAKGIGLPSLDALDRGALFTLRLPGIANRSAPPLDHAQKVAYSRADYAVDMLDIIVRIGESSAALDAELARRNVDSASMITAYNPFSAQGEAQANEIRQQWLQSRLNAAGTSFLAAEGRDPLGSWLPEPGVIAFGVTSEMDNRLMTDFEQHAIVRIVRHGPAELVFHPVLEVHAGDEAR